MFQQLTRSGHQRGTNSICGREQSRLSQAAGTDKISESWSRELDCPPLATNFNWEPQKVVGVALFRGFVSPPHL